ncbi:MAG: ATP-binding cassette domain-containing protein [Acidobacteria bacterium]|nr:ATP-binding cassette domain-containing protein [Acidobacteriota bacterium]
MLQFQSVFKTFNPGTRNEVRALRGVSLNLEAKSFVVIIGTNGSGKSTLLNAVAGTFPVDSGKITLDGRDITAWPEYRRAQLVGRVFQNPFSGTAPSLSILENIALATRRGLVRNIFWATNAKLRDQIRARVRMLNMGLEDRLENPIGSLSGRQRQALTLLMATWRKPSMLLLDEHTAALDPRSADQVISVTRQVIESDQLSALMVTHSMQQAASLGDRLLMVHRGRIVKDVSGESKRRLRPAELYRWFEELRRQELLDESAAELLRAQYV